MHTTDVDNVLRDCRNHIAQLQKELDWAMRELQKAEQERKREREYRSALADYYLSTAR